VPTGQQKLTNGPAAETIPRLGRDRTIELAKRHLEELTARQGAPAASAPPTSSPRLRAAGRRLQHVGAHVHDLAGSAWRFVKSPRRAPGRWWVRLRLLSPGQTFNGLTLLTIGFAVALGLSAYVASLSLSQPAIGFAPFDEPFEHGLWSGGLWGTIGSALFVGAVVGVLASTWRAAIWHPYLARRIRRQVRKRPDCVLLPSLSRRAVRLAPRDEPIAIVPRNELYDQLTPGILSRRRKDVQIVVGDPGCGKTTALIGIAGLLAKLGFVPVLVPLRSLDDVDLVELGRERFKQQIESYVRSDGEAEELWRWLRRRRRVTVLCDDLDRLSPDGERGFVLRKAIADATAADVSVIVTARPAGVPAGIAASAIDLGQLDPQEAVASVIQGARNDPGFRAFEEVPRQAIEQWVEAGRLADVPYYLELLAQLVAAGRFPHLPEPVASLAGQQRGVYRHRPDGTLEWNRWWVYFLLLERYYEATTAGRVRRGMGIEPRERESALTLLQDAALGTLTAAALEARATLEPRERQARARPERTRIEDFIGSDDRPLHATAAAAGATHRRPRVSAQEVIETGERLRLLDRDAGDEPQFRHRITQAYLAGRRLAVLEFERIHAPGGGCAPARADTIDLLLDRRHPEKLTALTALTFAALCADAERRTTEERARTSEDPAEATVDAARARSWGKVAQLIAWKLLDSAYASLDEGTAASPAPAPAAPARAPLLVTLLVAAPGTRLAALWSLLATISTRNRDGAGDRASCGPRDLDPMHVRNPDARCDPDDALIKLTTAADVARAIECEEGKADAHAGVAGDPDALVRWRKRRRWPAPGAAICQCEILAAVRASGFVTRWTKLNAIAAIAALTAPARWQRIWEFARDPDYEVRQAAGDVLDRDAFEAYRALEGDIARLLTRAAARSALGLPLLRPLAGEQAQQLSTEEKGYDASVWDRQDVEGLKALGSVLPAIVSGLREDPSAHAPEAWRGHDGSDADSPERRARPLTGDGAGDTTRADFTLYVRHARTALEQLVALAFQGGCHDLEAAVAKGFRSDAMRHVDDAEPRGGSSHRGPGWVANHARLVATVGLGRAEFWYAQLVLGQALALYAVAGANRQLAYDALARSLHRGGTARHPFTQRAVRMARAAVRRADLRGQRWRAYVWPDEVQGSHRHHVGLRNATAQLLADVTILLDLNEGAEEDRQDPFGYMRELPYCLHGSRDRREILAAGCPPECGWNLCPYKQPPPDEPNEHRGVSRAFCRQQRWIAWHRQPAWQRAISHRRLASFWEEMERRART
jgi:hypothetical protein